MIYKIYTKNGIEYDIKNCLRRYYRKMLNGKVVVIDFQTLFKLLIEILIQGFIEKLKDIRTVFSFIGSVGTSL